MFGNSLTLTSAMSYDLQYPQIGQRSGLAWYSAWEQALAARGSGVRIPYGLPSTGGRLLGVFRASPLLDNRAECGIVHAYTLCMLETNIPEFKSVDEESDFWDQHSAVEFLDEDSVVEIDASKAREKRTGRSTQQISLRVSQMVLERTKRRAKTLGVPYQTLIQLWIAERLEEEEANVKSLPNRSAKRKPRSSSRSRTSSE